MFKAEAHFWECKDCCTRNNVDATNCIACRAPAPEATVTANSLTTDAVSSTAETCTIEEEKIFGQRAKLYRFDKNIKEWKELGTGEMKLLYHAQNGTYRLLLRREQVFKTVCNLLLTEDLEFRELYTSSRAWGWTAMNYADFENPEVEDLAVRFKSQELALEFKEAIDKAQQVLGHGKRRKPAPLKEKEEEEDKAQRILAEKQSKETNSGTQSQEMDDAGKEIACLRKKLEEMETLCVVCQENVPTYVYINCGHARFCGSCVSKNTSGRCMLCRTPGTSRKFFL